MISPGVSARRRGRSIRGMLLVLAMFVFGGLALAGLFMARSAMSPQRAADVERVPATEPSP